MAQIDKWLSDAQGGFTLDELTAAFNQVKNPENWKLPISVTVPADCDPEIISRAITWFTGCRADITAVQDSKSRTTGWHVEAVGYYAAVGL